MDTLTALLAKTYQDDYTHVSLEPAGKWIASNAFFDHYETARKQRAKLTFAERPGDHVPLILDMDIDITTDQAPSGKLYTEHEIVTLIHYCQNIIITKISKQHSRQDANRFVNRNLWCILLEKEMQKDKTRYKNGFHLHFPHLFLDKAAIRNVIIPAIRLEIANNNLFATSPTGEAVQHVALDDVATKPWLMYGSSKPNSKPYVISKIYNHKREPITIKECFNKENTTNVSMLMSISDKLSAGKVFALEETISAPDIKPIPVQTKPSLQYATTTEELDIDKVRTLVSFISPHRADGYDDWWTIGITLHSLANSDDESEKLLDIWKEFSAHSEKYDEESCNKKWENMSRSSKCAKKMGSLIYLARTDNPDKTNNYLASSTICSYESGYIPNTDTAIVEMLVKQYESLYMSGGDMIYKFNGVVWAPLEKHTKEFRMILIKFSRYYKTWFKNYKEDHLDDDDLIDKERLMRTLIHKCQNNGPQMAIIKVLEDFIAQDRLIQRLNYNPNLIAFQNGVYDFENLTFRQGSPDDFLSKQLNVIYNQSYSLEHPHVVMLEEFLSSLYQDNELKQYIVYKLADIFIGGNADKEVMIWTGSGDNGKSAIQHIIEYMMGVYAIKFPKAILIGDTPKAGACLPELTRAQGGIRWAVIDELAPDDMMNAGMVKYLSGGDSMYARDCFQKGADVFEFEPYFKLIIICNKIPNIKNPDSTTWERIRVIPHETKFVTQMPKNPTPYHRLGDKTFLNKNRKKILAEALAWYLIQKHIEKKTKHIQVPVPHKVTAATELYMSQVDTITDFITEMFVADKTNTLEVATMYSAYKHWYKESQTTNLNIDKKDFVGKATSTLIKLGYTVENGTCKRIKYKESDSIIV